MTLLNVGYGNMVSAERIVSIVSPEAAPIKRLVQDARDLGAVIDASCGKKTLSVIICDSRHVILSSLTTEALSARLEQLTESENK
ncbi:MAG: DUF370 domain-containing protein [Ruminococcaceae bacterium]|nr:DUF370 domain-containing protein [Oscillospiraceae bacterium]